MTQEQSHVDSWIRYRRPEDRDAVVEEYRYLCRRAARRFIRNGLDRADLEQVGAVGLIKAVDRYDAAATTPFEAYAWLLVLGELMHYVRDGERLLRAPRRMRDLERRWLAAERYLWSTLGRAPREEDVARYVNATPAELRDVRDYRASGRTVSLEATVTRDSQDFERPFDAVLDDMTLESFFSELTPLQVRIVRSIHLDGVSVVELAKQMGYSRRHLTRLHRAAMQRLRGLGERLAGDGVAG